MKPLRKIIFWLHLSLGVAVGAIVLSMSATGMLLAFEPQIVAYAERDLRKVSDALPSSPKLTVREWVDRSASVSPGSKLSSITLSADPAGTTVLGFGREGGTYYMHPYAGNLLGPSSKSHDFMHAVEEWHRWLGSRELGKPVTGAACLGFFALALSGLVLWWPRRWTPQSLRAVALPRLGLRGRARDWNWHNAFGFWFLPLILLTTTTGAVMSYRWANVLFFRALGSEPPPPQENRGERKEGGQGAKPHSQASVQLEAWADSLPALATSRLPQWETLILRLPSKGQKAVQVTLLHDSQSGFARRSSLQLEAKTGEVIQWTPYHSQSLAQRARVWVRYLHSGEALGIIGQTVMAITSLVSVLLVFTGLAMTWRRFFGRRVTG